MEDLRFVEVTVPLLFDLGMVEILLANNCGKFVPDCPDLVFASSRFIFEASQCWGCLDELLGTAE
jgi:hypothetical protein